ncbi:hypothetical protein D2926_19155 [Vibrio cholerae]|nr:hypothetical protein D2926_19155 [Vibrio cholerae]TLE26182.1 hypothetical protein D2927_19145 [Vibrio cholerae]TLE28351.1 hypothetical protein D2928_19155 [Vibrio cholerae]TLE38894.1 hypothetical protein D2929_19205 [Vibrio cholerae]TLE46183.1 hypothetical protein D2930_19180 [Vibrio cholerae]
MLIGSSMYQLEVKFNLVKHHFSPSDGWQVLVDVDAMELAKGPQHPAEKKARVEKAEEKLLALGANIGAHPKYGRVDVCAIHPTKGTYLVEVEGQSSKQKEQAMYSALGQTLLQMNEPNAVKYCIAVPDEDKWQVQIEKIPSYIKTLLNLSCLLVSVDGVREL